MELWNLQSLILRQAWIVYEEQEDKNDMFLLYAVCVCVCAYVCAAK